MGYNYKFVRIKIATSISGAQREFGYAVTFLPQWLRDRTFLQYPSTSELSGVRFGSVWHCQHTVTDPLVGIVVDAELVEQIFLLPFRVSGELCTTYVCWNVEPAKGCCCESATENRHDTGVVSVLSVSNTDTRMDSSTLCRLKRASPNVWWFTANESIRHVN